MSDTPAPPPENAAGPAFQQGPEHSVFEDRSRWLWVIALALVVAGVASFWAAKPLYRTIKVRRASAMAEAGIKALANHNMQEAARQVRAALALAPKVPAVLRLAARYSSQMASSQGINYWEQLLATDGALESDRQEFARYAQDMGRLDISGALIKELIARNPANATNQLLVIDQHALLRSWPAAIRGAELYLQLHAADPYASFLFARAVMAGGDAQKAPRAKAILDELAKGNSPQKLPALRTLGGIRGLPKEEAAGIAKQLATAAGATAQDKLESLDILARLNPADMQARLHEAGDVLASADNPAAIAECVAWLRRHGGSSVVLDSLPAAKAHSSELLTMHRIEALADLKRWNDIAELLDDPQNPLSPVARACAVAMLEHGRGNSVAVAVALNAAAKAAGSNVERLQQIALLAATVNMPGVAIEIAEKLLADPRSVLWSADFLLRAASVRDDMQLEREVYGHLATQLGAEPVAVAEKDYLDLLFDDNVAAARASLARLSAANPGSFAIRTIFALAELKNGKPQEALALLDGARGSWQQQEPRWQVIAVAVLAANQDRAAARRIGSQIDTKKLKAPERHLLDASLQAR